MKLSVLLFMVFLYHCVCLNQKLLNIEKPTFSDKMKQFMTFIIETNSLEKLGFLFVAINKIPAEYCDFLIKLMSQKSSTHVVNLDKNRTPNLHLDPNHFKFSLCDPEDELDHAQNAFAKVNQTRSKIVLLFIQEPSPAFLSIVLQAYWAIQVVNVILAYESMNEIVVLSYNPYKPNKQTTLNLTSTKYTKDLFEDKTKDLFGRKVRALLTYRDRTKIMETDGAYIGKDYEVIKTIVEKINGDLEVQQMDYWTNPWHESVDYENRTQLKIDILKQHDISILIKSESFNVNDDVIENLYPHTQNDLCCLIRKSTEMTVLKKILSIYPPREFFVVLVMPWLICFVLLTVRRMIAKSFSIQTARENLWILIAFRIPKQPIDRLIILAWIMICFIISTYWQSKFTSLFALKQFDPELDTVEEVFATGIPMYALLKDAEEVRKKYEGTQYDRFKNSVAPLPAHEGMMDEIIGKDYSSYREVTPIFFLVEHDFGVYISRRFKDDNGLPVYHLVRESIIPKLQSFKIAHGSPLYDIFNKNLRRLGEGGFVELWAKQAIFNATIRKFIHPDEPLDIKRKGEPLHIETFRFPFQMLFAGLVVSFVAFLGEIFLSRHGG